MSMGFIFLWYVSNILYHSNKKCFCCLCLRHPSIRESLLAMFCRPSKSLAPKKLQKNHCHLLWKGEMDIWGSLKASCFLMTLYCLITPASNYPRLEPRIRSFCAQCDPQKRLWAEGPLLCFLPGEQPRTHRGPSLPWTKWVRRGSQYTLECHVQFVWLVGMCHSPDGKEVA